MNTGRLCKRHSPGPILVFSEVTDIDAVLAKLEKHGRNIVLPKGG